jgi:hypothetical protein
MKRFRLSAALVVAVALLATPAVWACAEAGGHRCCEMDSVQGAGASACHQEPAPAKHCLMQGAAEPQAAIAAAETGVGWHLTASESLAVLGELPAESAHRSTPAEPPRTSDSPRFILFSAYLL